jgi:hypothetical protein
MFSDRFKSLRAAEKGSLYGLHFPSGKKSWSPRYTSEVNDWGIDFLIEIAFLGVGERRLYGNSR